MATVRIQVRRGTASQWTSANPTLAAGEMGVESDTNKFKFGNGSSTWTALSYANADTSGITEIAQDAIDAALSVGSGISKTYDDAEDTISISIDDTVVATLSGSQTLTNKTFTSPKINGSTAITATGEEINRVSGLTDDITTLFTNANDYTDTAIGSLQSTVSSDYVPVSIVGQADGIATLNDIGKIPMSQLNLIDAELNGDTVVENLEISGSLIFNGTATEINSTSLSIADPLIYMGADNPGNTVDLGFVSSFTDSGTYQHTGLVRDHAANGWVLFKGVTDEPTTTVNLAQGTADDLTVGGLHANSIVVGNVSSTEFEYLEGVTAHIQTQLDAKAPSASPVFTGTVSGVTKDHVGLANVDNTSDANKPVSTATQAELDAKLALAGGTMTGNLTLLGDPLTNNMASNKKYVDDSIISEASARTSAIADEATARDTAIGTAVSNHNEETEAHGATGAVVGTTNTQTITNKTVNLSSNTLTGTTAEFNSALSDGNFATLAGTETLTNKTITSPAGLVKADVGLANADNTSDANKPVSTAAQTALDLKADLAGPTFTGTVVLPSTTSVGDVSATELGYVNGVTSAIQTQLDDKLSKTGGTMTGALTLSADPSASLHAATKQYVDNTASGIVAKPQVLGATTANIDATYDNGTAGVGATLTHNTNGAFPSSSGGAEGWAVGKGILVKNQTNKAQNGRYYVSDMGSPSTPYILTRCGYCDEASEIPGAYIFVQDGTNAGTGWVQTVADATTFTVGTDDINVVQFSGSGTITAGTGITVSGNEVSISTGAITSSLILDGTIVNGDINASAAIDQSKISGLTSDLAAKAPLANPTFTGTLTVSASGIAFTDGTQTKEGVPSLTVIGTTIAGAYNLSTGGLSLRDQLIPVSGSHTITVPSNQTTAYPIGTSISFYQSAGSDAAFAEAAGVTILKTPGLKLRALYSSATLTKVATDTWLLAGDLKA